MKFSISSETLLRYINGIEKAVPKTSSLPILDNFHIHIQEGKLKISASDLVVFALVEITDLNIDHNESIEILMNSSILIDTLKRLPKQEISFNLSVDTSNAFAEIIALQGKYKIPSKTADGYPTFPPIEDSSQVITVDSKVFKNAISKTEFAIQVNDNHKTALSGLYFRLIENIGLDFVSTDAHKLVRYTVFDDAITHNDGFIIPKKTLSLLESTYKTDLSKDAYLNIYKSNNYCIIKIGPYKIACRLIDDTFPNYEAIVPKNNHNKLIINRKDLFDALRRIELFANHATYQAKFAIRDNCLTLSSEDIDFNSSATESLSCNYDGDNLEIGFNAKYLIEILDKIDSKDVMIELSQPNKAGLIKPIDNENKDKNYKLIMLLMPVTLNS